MFAHPVIILSIVTLIAVLAIGFWQLRSVRASQAKRGEVPGETTMRAHASAASVPVDNRASIAGDGASYRRQDDHPADELRRGKTPVTPAPARLWGGTPRRE